MSGHFIAVNGGAAPEIVTKVINDSRANVLSPQYVKQKRLESRPTEWKENGRPIYGRLPATSETYRIDFFNFVLDAGATGTEIENVGYVYIPYGQSESGPVSLEVVPSEDKESILVKGGVIYWKYGKNEILPVIANLNVLDVLNGKYDLAYELIYDDSPEPFLYRTEGYSLAGTDIEITSGTDSILGWRYSAVNAFTDNEAFWSSEDSLFPSYAQPSAAYLQWESKYDQSYEKVVLRCPAGAAYSGTATLSYVSIGSETTLVTTASGFTDGTFTGQIVKGGEGEGAVASVTVEGGIVTSVTLTNAGVGYFQGDLCFIEAFPSVTFSLKSELTPIVETTPKFDSTSVYFEFVVSEPQLKRGWNVSFSSNTVSIQSITVSGTLTLLEPQLSASPRSQLVMYPAGTLPAKVTNAQGKTIEATYCKLAQVEVDGNFKVANILDQRQIVRKEYAPVADWLTRPFDQDLINLYEQVSNYSTSWLSPASSMKQEYSKLSTDQITVII